MSLQSGDIVLIHDAPYTNRLDVKARPCLVISGSQFNNISPDVILAPISSNVRYQDPKQVEIKSDDPDFSQTGLKQFSAVKCGAIFAYSRTQVRTKIGFVQPQILEQVRKKVISFLTLD